jgi:hypothetical protein
MRKVYKRETKRFVTDIARLPEGPTLGAMKNLIQNMLRALQAARLRRMNEQGLADLDAHTLRDIGLDRASERARLRAARYRVHIGLF